MLPLLLLLPLLWGGSLQEYPGYELHIPELVTVQEGLCVIVFCEFYLRRVSFTTDQLCIYWYWTGGNIYSNHLVATNCQNLVVKTETQGRFHLLGDPKTNNCSLSIRDARKSDTGTYELQVWTRQYVQYFYQNKLNLQVTDLTEKPDIHILEPLQSGSPTNLTCSLPGSCDGGRLLTFSWMGDALNMLDPSTLQSSVLTLTPRPQDHGTYLTCQVKHHLWPWVTMERTVRLNVSYAPQNLTIKIFFNGTVLKVMGNTIPLPILEGQSLHLVCVADIPPAELSWFQGSRALNASPIFNMSDPELPPVRIGNEGEFTCQAQNSLGSQHVSLCLSLLYSPQLPRPSCSWEVEGLHCSCSPGAWPAPSLRRRVGDQLVEGNSSNASVTVTSSSAGSWANSSLSLHKGLSPGLGLYCEAGNDHGNQSVTVLLLPGELLRPRANGTLLPLLEGQSLLLVCVADSNPPATLSWAWEGKDLSTSQPSVPGLLARTPNVRDWRWRGVHMSSSAPTGLPAPYLEAFVLGELQEKRWENSFCCTCFTKVKDGSWPLILTLIRGAVMGAGFLLTYGLTWIYYTCAGAGGRPGGPGPGGGEGPGGGPGGVREGAPGRRAREAQAGGSRARGAADGGDARRKGRGRRAAEAGRRMDRRWRGARLLPEETPVPPTREPRERPQAAPGHAGNPGLGSGPGRYPSPGPLLEPPPPHPQLQTWLRALVLDSLEPDTVGSNLGQGVKRQDR
ncbi:LOW QUALITY PROTEIN: sialic acid-binding Ig-like lectin 5 [Dugong dugon]